MVSSETTKPSTTPETGLAACSSTVAPKPAPFSNIKSTNYLPNVMAQVQAEQQGLDVVRVQGSGFRGGSRRSGMGLTW